MKGKRNTIIESIGIYLPKKVVSTRQTVAACKRKILFPIEDLTGIRSTHMAGDDEFAIDLAQKAIVECFAHSRYEPEDIDLLVCCNISRCDGAHFRYSFEPSTAVKLRKHFGFERALVFDVSNACPGMFTAIKVVDSFIKAGAIRRGMVVSGEYITHLVHTAQLEIEGIRDPRLACLTLGDSGAAVILEEAAGDGVGFHEIDIYTAGRYSRLCIAKVTDREHGGAIMYTQPVKLTPVALEHATAHAVRTIRAQGWGLDGLTHIIPHQTSRKTLADMAKIVNRLCDRDGWAETVTIENLEERGNTATTSHFVTVVDNIHNGRINSGDNVLFSIAGSGLTVGTALFTFDDLPDRLRRSEPAPHPLREKKHEPDTARAPRGEETRVKIRGVGTVPEGWRGQAETVEMAKSAVERCMARSALSLADINVLIFSGVYRTDFIYEPAMASMIAGALNFKSDVESAGSRRTLAFDLCNGGLGFLNACHAAAQMIHGEQCDAALVVASEVENNTAGCPEKPRGVAEAASAVLLSRPGADADGVNGGFGRFLFRYYGEYLDDFQAYCAQQSGASFVRVETNGSLEEHYLECIPRTVEELLTLEGLALSRVRWIVPPQRSSDFILRLSQRMNVGKEKFIDVARPGKDLLTSSLGHALGHILEHRMAGPGDIAVLIDVGAGIQVGCAIYYF